MLAGDANLSKTGNILAFTNSVDSNEIVETNLVSFYDDVQLVDVREMLKTNGLECWANILDPGIAHLVNPLLRPPVCWVYLHNHSTNYIGCLRMPAPYLCRVVLFDEQGRQVKKTKLGETYGRALSQDEIDAWCHNWNNPHERRFIRILAGGIPKIADMRTDICFFDLKAAFEIKNPGNYELHLQMRLIQTGQDSSGKFHYPVTWLSEVVTKIKITPEDVQK